MVRCQVHLDKNVEAHNGVENDLQGIKKGRDGEMVIFLGEGGPRAVEYHKRLKISLRNAM
jgi:hypothetical protein